MSLRQEPLATQQATLASVLDTLDALAAERQTTLGIVLDEFQEITRFGVGRERGSNKTRDPGRNDQPEWHLRGVIQRHQHLSYVLAGSKPALLEAMVGQNGAFYQMLDPYPFGPIAKAHICAWIDERLRSVGLQSDGASRWTPAAPVTR